MKTFSLSPKASALLVVLFSVFSFLSTSHCQVTQGVSSDGRDFYVGMVLPEVYRESGGTNFTIFKSYILITTAVENSVAVSYFDDATGKEQTSQSYKIAANSGIQVPLNTSSVKMDEPGEIPQFRACHISAKYPVNVEYFSEGADAGGSYLALQTNSLGKKYVIASYPDAQPSIPTQMVSSGFFEIIAPFDNTVVSITPNTTTKGGHPGVHSGTGASGVAKPFKVTLRRGQCYLVKSAGTEADADISGSVVESTLPIAVLAGHENALITTASFQSDSRDFMIEEMLPVESWDSTGYVSLPLKDSQPFDQTREGVGENYRMYAYDQVGVNAQMIEVNVGARELSSARFATPAAERFGVLNPIEMHSTDGKLFSVMMYDQRDFGNNYPIPGPSMMSIVPISHWQKRYSWYIPYSSQQTSVSNFINIIGKKDEIASGIAMSHNGSAYKSVKLILTQEAVYYAIPNHPDLAGVRLIAYPGSYSAYSLNPFMVYEFGFHPVGPDGDFDADEFFPSNANPCGALLFSGDPAKITTVIDSQCTQWNICAIDGRTNDPGIRSITLLKDPDGTEYQPAKQSVNCRIDPLTDDKNLGQLIYPGNESRICVSIQIEDPLIPAYAAILITDNAGNVKLSELTYRPPAFAVTPSSSEIYFAGVTVGRDTCVDIVVKNAESLAHNATTASLDPRTMFSIASVTPPLPVLLRHNDSLIVHLCYHPQDTLLALNTLRLDIDCFTIGKHLIATGSTGLITATDRTFDKVDSGKSVMKNVTVTNIGKQPFTLTKSWKLIGSTAFAFIDSQKLPVVLQPGSATAFNFNYSPKAVGVDSALMRWSTDILAPYNESIKSYSQLSGVGNRVIITRAVHESSATKNISVRPNPASGSSVILSFGFETEKAVAVSVFDVLGRNVFEKTVTGLNEIEIPIRKLPNGCYTIRVNSEGIISTEKFEVAR
ncbi:MAG: choice-of-anchor D domain-containing protein [bacterium]